MQYYVYIVTCSDGSYYTGYTNNLRRRLNAHNGIGLLPGAKYTRSRRPVFLSHVEKFSTKHFALKREYEIKQLSHTKKKAIIEQTNKEEILAAI